MVWGEKIQRFGWIQGIFQQNVAQVSLLIVCQQQLKGSISEFKLKAICYLPCVHSNRLKDLWKKKLIAFISQKCNLCYINVM